MACSACSQWQRPWSMPKDASKNEQLPEIRLSPQSVVSLSRWNLMELDSHFYFFSLSLFQTLIFFNPFCTLQLSKRGISSGLQIHEHSWAASPLLGGINVRRHLSETGLQSAMGLQWVPMFAVCQPHEIHTMPIKPMYQSSIFFTSQASIRPIMLFKIETSWKVISLYKFNMFRLTCLQNVFIPVPTLGRLWHMQHLDEGQHVPLNCQGNKDAQTNKNTQINK